MNKKSESISAAMLRVIKIVKNLKSIRHIHTLKKVPKIKDLTDPIQHKTMIKRKYTWVHARTPPAPSSVTRSPRCQTVARSRSATITFRTLAFQVRKLTVTGVLCFEGILKTNFIYFWKCAFCGRICVLDCDLELVSVQISNCCVVVRFKLKVKSLFGSQMICLGRQNW